MRNDHFERDFKIAQYGLLISLTILIVLISVMTAKADIIKGETIFNLSITNDSVQVSNDKQSFMFENRPGFFRLFKIQSDVNVTITNNTIINNTVNITVYNNTCELNTTVLLNEIQTGIDRSQRTQSDNFLNVVTSTIVSPRKTLDEALDNLSICRITITNKDQIINISQMQMEFTRNQSSVNLQKAQQEVQAKDREINNYIYIVLLLIVGLTVMFLILLWPYLREAMGYGGTYS